MDPNLIDRIYECAFAPELWPCVLDELARLSEARGAVLLTAKGEVSRWTASPKLQDDMAAYAAGGWLSRGDRHARLLAARHMGFLTEYEVFTEDELEQDPSFREFLRPRALGRGATMLIPAPTGDNLLICVERDYARGPVERDVIDRLDSLRPHLARAALISARLQLELARAMSETLALLGLPALVFGDGGRVLAANDLAEGVSQIRWRARDQIALSDPAADAMLRQALDTLGGNGQATRSFAIRAKDRSAAMVAHLTPIRRSARDCFTRCAGVLILTPVTLPRAPPVELVQSLFDLTPAEARVARRIAVGETLDAIAAEASVSINTVRSQLRGVLMKTGCRRQSEIVALLGGVAPARIEGI